ncbi:MAG: phosphoadenylyl-sulfate reductase [Gammaproteobacteria bacterium]
MNAVDCSSINTLDEVSTRSKALHEANVCLSSKTAEQRVTWALQTLPGVHLLSSSFGAQAAVSLHLLTQQAPDLPVVFIDTGYHFPETYRFTDELCERLNLNLKVYRPEMSAAWQEARKGQRWKRGLEGIESYNLENKVEPMQQALEELDAGVWFAGLRAVQSTTRRQRRVVEFKDGVARQNDIWKVHPIIDWTDKDVYDYLKKHRLPYHPLWEKGYVSIGDKQLTRPLHEVGDIESTRFLGLKRECGLHDVSEKEGV